MVEVIMKLDQKIQDDIAWCKEFQTAPDPQWLEEYRVELQRILAQLK